MKDFTDKVAVVTGGASGIGEGLVEALLQEGAKVVIADIEQPVLEEALGRLEGKGEVSGIVTDVSNPESVEACAQQVYDTYGVCHLLFNNAGVGGGGVAKPWNWTPNDWTWCFGVNLFGVGHCVASFVPRMIDGREEGWVVNTSSGDGGFQPLADLGVYAASKAAVSTYTECLANAFINEGTRLARRGVLSGRQRIARDPAVEQQSEPSVVACTRAPARRPAVGLPGSQEADGSVGRAGWPISWSSARPSCRACATATSSSS